MSQKTLKTMKQYNSQDIYGIFSEGFEQGFFKRVGTAGVPAGFEGTEANLLIFTKNSKKSVDIRSKIR